MQICQLNNGENIESNENLSNESSFNCPGKSRLGVEVLSFLVHIFAHCLVAVIKVRSKFSNVLNPLNILLPTDDFTHLRF